MDSYFKWSYYSSLCRSLLFDTFLHPNSHFQSFILQESEQQGVRFLVSDRVPGEDPESEPERQRLHRRDTPHHLKNKRINQQVDKEKVASIIAQALKKQEETTDKTDAAPSSNGQPGLTEILIKFERADKGLGLSIAGGLGSTPYKDNDEGIFISRVTAGGPADIAGLRKDDKVLSVNGYSCVNIDHYTAVDILKAAGSNIDMRVVRETPQPISTNGHQNTRLNSTPDDSASLSSLSQPASSHSQKSLTNKAVSPFSEQASSTAASSVVSSVRLERVYTTLIRDASTGSFGFSISGGKGADQFIEGDDSVYISKVAEAGPAHRDGKIQVGDKLVQVRLKTSLKCALCKPLIFSFADQWNGHL